MLSLNLRWLDVDMAGGTIDDLLHLLPESQAGYVKASRIIGALMQDGPLVLDCAELQRRGNRVVPYRNFLAQSHAGELGFIFGTWDTGRLMRWLSGLPQMMRDSDKERALAQEANWMGIVGSFLHGGIQALPLQATAPEALYVEPNGLRIGQLANEFTTAVAEVLRTARRPASFKLPYGHRANSSSVPVAARL